jgi:hypothetical protein
MVTTQWGVGGRKFGKLGSKFCLMTFININKICIFQVCADLSVMTRVMGARRFLKTKSGEVLGQRG